MFWFARKSRHLNLALQGGGAHGAFTWGVIDRLLEEPSLKLGWLSGTSAGAINAVAVAAGLAEDGPAGARRKLREVWEAVIEAGSPELLRYYPFLNSFSRSQAMSQIGTQIGSMFSPYEFNPLGFDPLRKLLETHIDFAKLRAFPDIGLLIAATDVATGRARLFRRHEVTIEAVLASTCLPQMHHAVEIEGRAYWDGGFSANPDLLNLAGESPVGDSLLVLLNPIEKIGRPRTARDIAAEVNRVTFTQPLLRDIAELSAVREDRPGFLRRRGVRAERIARHRFHLIETGHHTATLAAETKMRADRGVLTMLHNAGRDEADRWLESNLASIGRTSTVDLGSRFLGPLRPFSEIDAAARIDRQQAEAEELAEKL